MNGVERIAAERQCQVDKEDYGKSHDDHHEDGELASAAVCYAAPERVYRMVNNDRFKNFIDPFPWDEEFDKRVYRGTLINNKDAKPAERIRMLEKAGALIAAEIDRLLRLDESKKDGNG